MAQLVTFFMSLAMSCSVRREISPCTCVSSTLSTAAVDLTCDGVDSFNRVFDSLQNRFNPDLHINLVVTKSQLEDMETKSFKDMNLRLTRLKLSYDNLKTIPESSFRNLTHLKFLSLSDNNLEEVPRHIFKHTPNLGTIDLGAGRIRRVGVDDFRYLQNVEVVLLYGNNLTEVDYGSMPNTVKILHLSKNNLTTLNGTIRHMPELKLLFLNDNRLTSLDNELPLNSTKLTNLLIHNNQITHFPPELRSLTRLTTIYTRNNRLSSLDGLLRHSRHLEFIEATNNRIDTLASDEFQDCEELTTIDMSINRIRSVNGSLLPLYNLRLANFSFNLLTDFSLNEIRGLTELRMLDLSNNQIDQLSGKLMNNVEPDLYLMEMRLQHNRLKSLDGALMGMNQLIRLDLSHNQLSVISPDDLIGLELLEGLDISYNLLQTLEETSKSFLPKLNKLNASNNNLTILGKDFNGLPFLCEVDLSNNQIISISPNLVDNTRCLSHSVYTTMDINLHGNPVLCQNKIIELTQLLLEKDARIKGEGDCAEIVEIIELPSNLANKQRELSNEPAMAYLPDNSIVEATGNPAMPPIVTTMKTTLNANAQESELEEATTSMLTRIVYSPLSPLNLTSETVEVTTTTPPETTTSIPATASTPTTASSTSTSTQAPATMTTPTTTTTTTPTTTTTFASVYNNIQTSDEEQSPIAQETAVYYEDLQPSDIVTLPDPLISQIVVPIDIDINIDAEKTPTDILELGPPQAILTDESQPT